MNNADKYSRYMKAVSDLNRNNLEYTKFELVCNMSEFTIVEVYMVTGRRLVILSDENGEIIKKTTSFDNQKVVNIIEDAILDIYGEDVEYQHTTPVKQLNHLYVATVGALNQTAEDGISFQFVTDGKSKRIMAFDNGKLEEIYVDNVYFENKKYVSGEVKLNLGEMPNLSDKAIKKLKQLARRAGLKNDPNDEG